jgi:hyperosmotically inducible periplasmic protein
MNDHRCHPRTSGALFCLLLVSGLVTVLVGACSPSQQQRAKSDMNDAFIAAQVHARLAGIDAATVSLVTVDVTHGVVTLTGQVHSQHERGQADLAVRGVAGVTGVVDRLVVNPKAPTAEQIEADVQMQARVKAALAAQTGVNALHVQTDVHQGVVTLQGTYPSAPMHEVILETVRGVPGVHKVVDHMRAAPPSGATGA